MSSPSPEQREYAALPIAKATGDERATDAPVRSAVMYDVTGFHGEQAVEKATAESYLRQLPPQIKKQAKQACLDRKAAERDQRRR